MYTAESCERERIPASPPNIVQALPVIIIRLLYGLYDRRLLFLPDRSLDGSLGVAGVGEPTGYQPQA